MKRYWFRITMIGYLSFILMGCNQVTNPNVPNSAAPSPAPGDTTQMTPSLPTPAVPGLQNLIETARTDLAQRLGVSVDEIAVLEAASVTWPDSSLGCAQEGLMYLPALTPGYLIRLAALDQEYEYHTNQESLVVYCANPSPPMPGMPVDR